MAHDKVNRLLSGQGSIQERNRIATELDDETLQKAVPYSAQAKVEWERRIAERALQANNQWFKRPVGMTVLAVVASLIVWALLR
jgi:type IV secretory pathway TrbF-like protein